MKKIFTVLMLVSGMMAANAAELVCEGLVHRAGNNNCKYQPTFSWTAGNSNTMQVFAFEAGTLSQYDSLYITLSDFVDMTDGQTVGGGNKVRLLFLAGSSTVKTQQFATINGGEKKLDLTTLITDEQRASVTEIAFGGSCAAGSIAVDPASIQLVKADGTKVACEGFEKRPSNNKCSFGNVFSWSASTANTMELFSLTAGDLANYDTLYITMSNFKNLDTEDVGNGYKVRVVFMAEGAAVKTQNFSNIGGEKKIVLADIMNDEEIASVDLVVIGGACTAGSVEVEASSIRLYGEEKGDTTAIDEIQAEPRRAYKTIENGRVVIIRDNVRYDLTGKQL